MAYYKILQCDDYENINESVKCWISKIDKSDSKVFWNPVSAIECFNEVPALARWLIGQKLAVKTIALTVGNGPNCCGPHRDTPPARFKLSWPILNTATTWNRFYIPKLDRQSSTINELGGESWKHDALIEVDRVKVEKPMLIDAGTIHDVWCEEHTVWPRLGLQMQLMNEPISL